MAIPKKVDKLVRDEVPDARLVQLGTEIYVYNAVTATYDRINTDDFDQAIGLLENLRDIGEAIKMQLEIITGFNSN